MARAPVQMDKRMRQARYFACRIAEA